VTGIRASVTPEIKDKNFHRHIHKGNEEKKKNAVLHG